MKKFCFSGFIAVFFLLFATTACKESVPVDEEFSQWQTRNDQWFDSIYNVAQARIAAGDTSWRILTKWSKEDVHATQKYDHIVVHVQETGTGSGFPLTNDTVRIHLEGHLRPSVSYPEGYLVERSFVPPFNPQTATPRKLGVTVAKDGLSTALQQMRIGDRWTVYVPYQLAYNGGTGTGYVTPGQTTVTIPAYSALVYDVTLVAYYRPGQVVPPLYLPKK